MQISRILHLSLFSWVFLASAVGLAAGKAAAAVKSADLKGTRYCRDEFKLRELTPITHLDERNKIDRIVISKKGRKLYLLSGERVYKAYDVTFGFGFYDGNKIRQGDGRTPEGMYRVELKNAKSSYHKALRVSYPNARDKAFAKAKGVDPGGDIMIHGLPKDESSEIRRWAMTQAHTYFNWTQGCIAVTDQEIDEIFSVVGVNTEIEICPR